MGFKHMCDKCDKEIEHGQRSFLITEGFFSPTTTTHEETVMELCRSCFEASGLVNIK